MSKFIVLTLVCLGAPLTFAMGKKPPAADRPYIDLQVSILRLCKEGRPSEVLQKDLRLSFTFADAPLVLGIDLSTSQLEASIENGLLVLRRQSLPGDALPLGVPAWDTQTIRCDLDVNDGNSEAAGTIPIELAEKTQVTVQEDLGTCFKAKQSDQTVYRRVFNYVVVFSNEFEQMTVHSTASSDFETKEACKNFKRTPREP